MAEPLPAAQVARMLEQAQAGHLRTAQIYYNYLQGIEADDLLLNPARDALVALSGSPDAVMGILQIAKMRRDGVLFNAALAEVFSLVFESSPPDTQSTYSKTVMEIIDWAQKQNIYYP